MTHDELVRFAAGKVGATITRVAVFTDVQPGYAKDAGFAWFEVDSEDGSIGVEFDLTSPELFLKGLGVFKDESLIKKAITCEIAVSGLLLMYPWFDDAEADDWVVKREFTDVKDIPLKFWECWAELEGGQG